MKAGFYENLILKTVIQKSEQKRSKFKEKKTKKDKFVSGEDRTQGLGRVKPMMRLCANLAVDWNAKIVGKLLRNNSV